MSHRPKVCSERPIKTRTLDRLHKADLVRREANLRPPQPSKPAKPRRGRASTSADCDVCPAFLPLCFDRLDKRQIFRSRQI